MNCGKCLDKCKAECCGLVPFDKTVFARNRGKQKREILEVINVDDTHVVIVCKHNYCVFLDANYKCSIYDERPEVCKLYGNIDNLPCFYQDKEGNMRTRQDRRRLSRKYDKKMQELRSNI